MRKVMFAALAAIAVTTSASAQAHDDQPPSSSEKPWSQADAYFGKETMADARRAMGNRKRLLAANSSYPL